MGLTALVGQVGQMGQAAQAVSVVQEARAHDRPAVLLYLPIAQVPQAKGEPAEVVVVAAAAAADRAKRG